MRNSKEISKPAKKMAPAYGPTPMGSPTKAIFWLAKKMGLANLSTLLGLCLAVGSRMIGPRVKGVWFLGMGITLKVFLRKG
jgi:hypothetical protein